LLVTHDMGEAEALCDRIIVMRAGQVLDTGTPAELVARHARQATVSFSRPDQPAGLLAEIGRLDGVRDVRQSGARVTVDGDRCMIAYVGAALVRHGSVPEDLAVHVPDLNDAMLSLLEPGPAGGPAKPESGELVGGRR
jgi:ABC-2 type transport system ATP-binding protein